ncbi:MAG: efflux RND transporter periplasmic adaptor subunit [Pseudomonadota bacterium]
MSQQSIASAQDGAQAEQNRHLAPERTETGRQSRRRAALLGGAALAALVVAGHANSVFETVSSVLTSVERSTAAVAATPQAVSATPVDITRPDVRRITEWDEYTGRFVAIDSVQVRARVSGYLEEIHFKDGQTVTAGDLLFTIDQRPFEAALAEAQADLASAQAVLENARAENTRGQELLARRTISREAADDRLRGLRQAEAQLKAAEARVARAELDLSFTEVRAPVSGRISDDAVSVGNLITGGADGGTMLTNIVSLDPIEFEFTVSEADYLKYVRLDRSGARAGSRENANTVFLKLIDEDNYVHEGEMRFVDNQFDASTGTMRGRAIFSNPNDVFAPGMFARIRLAGSAAYDAVLIPDAAIQTDQSEKFVWVATAQNTAERRTVVLGPVINGQRLIRSGLSPDDRLIVGGVQFVAAGAPIAPTERDVAEIAQKSRIQ